MGCLFGYSAGTVSDSSAGCAVTATGDNRRRDDAGGLIGRNDGTVRDSYATGNVRSDDTAGGLVGLMYSPGQITGSYATGAVSVSTAAVFSSNIPAAKAGGLVGQSQNDLTDSYATGNVTAAAGAVEANIGGLVGELGSMGRITGSHATGTVTGASGTTKAKLGGLVGRVSGGSQIISSYAAGAVTANGDASKAGGLVGILTSVLANNTSRIGGSYATGAVTANAPGNDPDNFRSNNALGNQLGGLVGAGNNAAAITASYATGAVSATAAGNNVLGGLVGIFDTGSPTISASYATSALSVGAVGNNTRGGLVGFAKGITGTPLTNSYWDSTINPGLPPYTVATNFPGSITPGSGSGQATTALQMPTKYGTTGIYANWNVDVDGDRAADDPWHFGSASQYPILKYGSLSPGPQGYAGIDYDRDDDGLIEINGLAQLNAVRYDRDGDGRPTTVPGYLAAFPLGNVEGAGEMAANGRMGCGYDHDNDQATAPRCRGYELNANLDFDTDGDGATYTTTGGTATVDADDTDNFFNGAQGWVPIGDGATGYSAVFEGNRHTIDNLYINIPAANTTRNRIGAVRQTGKRRRHQRCGPCRRLCAPGKRRPPLRRHAGGSDPGHGNLQPRRRRQPVRH